MKNLIRLLLVILATGGHALGQADTLTLIDKEVTRINADRSLTLREFDASEVYGHGFDGGGVIRVYLMNDEVRKIDEQIGLSFGRVTTIIYFSKGKPIKVIDREENFKIKDDQEIDHTQIHTVFEASIYIFNWDQDLHKTITTGKRVLSEGTRALFEYEAKIENAMKLVSQK